MEFIYLGGYQYTVKPRMIDKIPSSGPLVDVVFEL